MLYRCVNKTIIHTDGHFKLVNILIYIFVPIGLSLWKLSKIVVQLDAIFGKARNSNVNKYNLVETLFKIL